METKQNTTESRSFSVIICAYTEQRWEAMLAAVESIRRQSLPASQIILVIDHNPALFERSLAALADILVIENQHERGLSGARNSGLTRASGELIAFMDEDAIADPDWLERLSAGYADSQVMGVGGAILPLWPDRRPGWFPEEFDWVVGCTYLGLPTQAQPVRNLIGCNMSFRREVFAAVGDFREGIGRVGTLPVGCEETELCIRIQQHWTQSVFLYEPAARVQHRVTAQRATWDYFVSRCYAEGISKAQISKLVGARDGLSSERKYTFSTLPRGVLSGLADSLIHLDPGGVSSSVAIVAGLGMTTAGYLRGKLAGTTLSLATSATS
jgi:glycosyltransferase involved in cell wall biosynthesis